MKTIFLFSGQGSQYYHMGGKLFETHPVFRRHMLELDEMVRSIAGISVVTELYDPAYRLFDRCSSLRMTHPAIFMTGYALSKLLETEGIVPDYLLGCSLGEFISAALSGVLDTEDALKLIIKQAGIIENICKEGGMIAVLHDRDCYGQYPAIQDNSTVAAVNGPAQFVIAGEREALNLAKRSMKVNDIIHQELMVSYGFHSPAIDPAAEAYTAYLADKTFHRPGIPVISGVSGQRLAALPENYFWKVVREPVDFAGAVHALENSVGRDESLAYIDLGPSGSLANLVKYNSREGSASKAFQVMSPFQQEYKKLEELKTYYKENKKTMIARTPGKNEPLIAYVFPGQGSQRRGMGEDLFKKFPGLTDRAGEIVGYSVRDLCTDDPERKLNLTQYTQPALYVVNALAYLQLKEETGVIPDFVAGHSLGEYNALFAAGVLDFETGLKLVQKRGALMAKMKEGGMAAVKGLNREEIIQVLQRHGLESIDIANYNTRNQVVLSGPREMIARSGPCFEAAGATLYFPLNVSGAFHSRYMLPAKLEFEQFLQAFHFSPPLIPVVSNVEASFYPEDKTVSLLADQLIKPVRWVESIRLLLKKGEIVFKEVGPGDVLTKLVWSIQNDLQEAVA